MISTHTRSLPLLKTPLTWTPRDKYRRMLISTIITDFNGVVLFEPHLLQQRYGGRIEEGTDLFAKFTTSDEGDAVLTEGLVVPILAIDDSPYKLIVRRSDEPEVIRGDIVVENGVFPFACTKDWSSPTSLSSKSGRKGSDGAPSMSSQGRTLFECVASGK